MFRNFYKKILITAGLTALIGEVYFYPFGTGFRFTAGVIAISFLTLYFKEIPETILIPFSGVIVFMFRVFLSTILRDTPLIHAINLHYPSFFFYLTYGLILKFAKIRLLLRYPVNFISVMALADICSNMVELCIRHEMNLVYIRNVLTPVIGVGLIRSIITFSFYWLIERYKLIILNEEHQKRYSELLELLSELKAELFYMKKSTNDLENAMKEGYELYQQLNGQLNENEISTLRKKALNLAKDIHEIKKCYLRISSGFMQLMPEEKKEGMAMSAILSIIRTNTERWMNTKGIKAELRIYLERDLIITKYFTLFSILNNLLNNALDALEKQKNGIIEIKLRVINDQYIKLPVFDNGQGINPKDLPYIFEPGFSTKFMEDGSISTGLGLTHVKNLLEEMDGKITVKSYPGKGTKFEILIPLHKRFTKIFDTRGTTYEVQVDGRR